MSYKEKKLIDKFMNGGFGYGKMCLPYNFFELILIIIFPPIYVVVKQIINYKKHKSKEEGKDIYLIQFLNFKEIIINIILTSLFYFPGFIHALLLKTRQCEGAL